MMAGERFTSWLSAEERTALRAHAREHDCSENVVVRYALRALLFGKPIPAWMQDNRSNTSNRDKHVTGARG